MSEKRGIACNDIETKRQRMEESQDTAVNEQTPSFDGFEAVRILNENPQTKTMFIEGKYEGSEQKAVVILEKTPFSHEIMTKILTKHSDVKVNIQNDIYNTLDLYPPPQHNSIKSTLIYPATEQHITKYSAQQGYLVTETPDDFQNITLPYLEEGKFSTQWVYNILEKKKESERIVFEDPDPENGFILLPDMKWDGKQTQDLYLVAIVHRHGLRCLRDLSASHLPLLCNILHKGQAAILDKYDVPSSQLRIYLHYQPSYYHLHVHFTHLQFDAPGSGVERAHLLSDVIDNIELMNDYYQKKSITYMLKENSVLCKKFKEAGKL